MKMYNPEAITAAADVLAKSFAIDPGTAATLHGLSSPKKDALLKTHALLHLHYAFKNGLLHLLDGNPKAFLIGGPSDLESTFTELLLKLNIVFSSIPVAGFNGFFQSRYSTGSP